MFAILFLIFLFVFIIWCYDKSTQNFDYWKHQGVIFKKPVPFFGNISSIALCKLTQAECLQNIYREYSVEKFVGIYQLGTPTLLVRDPELIKQFLVKDFKHFTDRGFTFDEKKEPLTANLVNLEGIRWRILRQRLTPTFSTKKIKNMVHLLHQCGEQLLRYMQDTLKHDSGKSIEIRELTAKFTTDVIGSCAFGLQFNSMSETSSEFRKMGYKALQPSKLLAISKLIRVFFPKLFRILNLRSFPEEVNHFFLSMVSKTLQHRENNNEQREDFMQLLMEIRKSTDSSETDDHQFELTDNLIAAQAFVFFLAGFETSSTTLSFCLHELAVNQDVQNEVISEIQSATENHKMPFDYDALKDMTYLEKCLLETMRKYPPVQALARVCTKPYTIPDTNVHLKEGTALLIPVYAIHHDPQYYPDPEKFDPDRFSEANLSQKQNATYLPFGDGPRICIGMRFAIMEMKLALATFLYRYRVSLCDKSLNPLELDPASFILAPKNGIWLNIQERCFSKI